MRNKRKARKVSFRLLASFAVLIALVIISAGYRHGLAFNGYHIGGKTTRVKIDAFPRMSEKLIDRTTRPVTPVAIYGSDSFDAARVNPSSVSLNGAQPMLAASGNVRHKVRDVDGDGRKDMLVYFPTRDLKVANGDAMLAFQGETTDGSWIDGREAVRLTESPASALPTAETQSQPGQGASAASQGKPITPDTGQVFTSPGTILIPASGTGSTGGSPSTPYPSTVTVAGVPAAASYRITVQLFDLRHHSLDDVDMLLVNPAGTVKYLIFSDVGGVNSTCGATCDNGVNLGTAGPTISLSDTATQTLQDTTLPTTGAWKPADYAGGSDTFPAPAPAGPYTSPGATDTPTMNSTLGATSPNGVWSLYISDDISGDTGRLNGGWGLNIFTVTPTAAPATVSGQITTPDGQPLAGTVVQLSGGTSDRTITDAQGHYQ
ncbi:MAG TPA: carboxypeptidase-like regulatory domain-containing protein, partial [Pyrinomonadaceae bacterium]|nr:carboxypeptidase-like regulatory domain-containing protein [Pyrinomonadaceae bacterium]